MSLDFHPDSPFAPKRCIARLRAHTAELRVRLSASANQLGKSQRAVEQTYTMLANVGARYASARVSANGLSDAISPSVARAYMVARRLPGHAAEHAAEMASDVSLPA